jgi:hypothetical protein
VISFNVSQVDVGNQIAVQRHIEVAKGKRG